METLKGAVLPGRLVAKLPGRPRPESRGGMLMLLSALAALARRARRHRRNRFTA
ncbi:MAG: hypothetical protein V4757_07855 [Pseudomonadota bacterium]